MMNRAYLVRIAIVIIILSAITILAILLYLSFAPFGKKITYRYDNGEGPGFIKGLYPARRIPIVFEKGSPFRVLRANLAYFDVRLPRLLGKFKSATVTIKFRNQNQKEFMVGLKDRPKWHYLFKPLDNKLLNYLNWNIVRDGSLTLMQKRRVFSNPRKFLIYPPDNSVIANYFFDPNYLKVRTSEPKDYVRSGTGLSIENTLRGPHVFYTYVKNEPIDFTIEKQDLNWRRGADPLVISIYRNNMIVFSKRIPDDGVTDDSRQARSPLVGSVRISLREGVYKVKLSCSNDVLIKRILTKQHLLVFENRLFLAGNRDAYGTMQTKPSTLYTDARGINIKTVSIAGFQEVSVGGQRLQINEIGRLYSASLPPGIKEIVSSRNDLVVKGPGFYSFSRESFFQPISYKVIEFDEKLNLDDIDFIATTYTLPSEEDGWLINQQTFDLSQAYVQDGVLRFALYAPGLSKKRNEIWIDYIEVTLKKPSIFGGQ